MIKRILLLATMTMALSGFTAAMAMATSTLRWADKGTALSAGTNPTITATGKAKFSNVTLGGTECPVKAEVTLTGGSATAHINEFVVTNTAECVLNGPLKTSCKALTGDTVTGTSGKPLNTANGNAWVATGTLNAGVASLDILSDVDIHNSYSSLGGGFCPPFVTLESTAAIKPNITLDSSTVANKATLGGSLTAFAFAGTHAGNVNVTGTLNIVFGFATYGIL